MRNMVLNIALYLSILILVLADSTYACSADMILNMQLWLPASLILGIFFKAGTVSALAYKINKINSVKFRVMLYIINGFYFCSIFALDTYIAEIIMFVLLAVYLVIELLLIFITLQSGLRNRADKQVGMRNVVLLSAKSFILFLSGNIVFIMVTVSIVFISDFGNDIIEIAFS